MLKLVQLQEEQEAKIKENICQAFNSEQAKQRTLVDLPSVLLWQTLTFLRIM